MKKFSVLLLLIVLTLSVSAQQPVATSVPGTLSTTDTYLRNQRLGIAHISAAEGGTDDARYRTALELGAGWNRIPIYWDRVERQQGAFNWSEFDRQIVDDIRYRLNINAILLGRPAFYQDEFRITGMYEPIFADGSDFAEPGKALNPANPWAHFVYYAVQRYMPGGVLSQQGTIPQGAGVRIWEIWNEPDHKPFWGGSIQDYARLLKISYIVIKQVDPEAQVMVGGLLFPSDDNWLARILAIYVNDAQSEANNWYMDIVAVHSYSSPWRTGWLVLYVRETMEAYGFMRPIWVNETGAPVWDDYPGPAWAEIDGEHTNRVTLKQQAWFYIQTAAYAWLEGADVIIYHQLYDDCGDQPAGTNFPPHRGQLCDFDNEDATPCFGDAHGMYRNLESSVCFSQHPYPGSPRPAADAYRLLAQVFDEPFGNPRALDIEDGISTDVKVMMFDRHLSDERITVMWNQRFETQTVEIPAEGLNGQLISLDDSSLIQPRDGRYIIELPPAEPDNYPETPFSADAAIGGSPYILIEKQGERIEPFVRIQPPSPDIPVTLFATQTPTFAVSSRPTVDPSTDTRAPTARLNPLPITSPPTFNLSWTGQDDSSIELFVIWVRRDGGGWEKWLETSETSIDFTGIRGSRYEFDIWARDLAGNWSDNVELSAQTVTRIQD